MLADIKDILIFSLTGIFSKCAANSVNENGVSCFTTLLFGVLVLNVFIYTKIDYRFGVVINSMASVLVVAFSMLILKETITKRRIAGNALIILGIFKFVMIVL